MNKDIPVGEPKDKNLSLREAGGRSLAVNCRYMIGDLRAFVSLAGQNVAVSVCPCRCNGVAIYDFKYKAQIRVGDMVLKVEKPKSVINVAVVEHSVFFV